MLYDTHNFHSLFTLDPEAYCRVMYSYYTCVARGPEATSASCKRLAATRLEDAEHTESNVREAERK